MAQNPSGKLCINHKRSPAQPLKASQAGKLNCPHCKAEILGIEYPAVA